MNTLIERTRKAMNLALTILRCNEQFQNDPAFQNIEEGDVVQQIVPAKMKDLDASMAIDPDLKNFVTTPAEDLPEE